MGGSPDKPKETASQRASAEVGAEQYQESRKLAPIRADTLKRYTDYKTKGQQLADEASTDQAIANAPQATQVVASAPDRTAGLAELALRRGRAAGVQAVDTNLRARQAEVGAVENAAGIVRGEQNDATAGLDELAKQNQESSLERSRTQAASSAATADAIAGGAGVVGGLYLNRPKPISTAGAT